jgi:hypothetical protein
MSSGNLPDGFVWNWWAGATSWELKLDGGRTVASATWLRDDCWRVGLKPDLASRRFLFFDSEADAVTYIEVWVRKWADRIRTEHTGISNPYQPYMPKD